MLCRRPLRPPVDPLVHNAPRGLAAVGVCVLLWGYSAVAIKMVGATGLVTAFYRLWLGIPALWVLLLLPTTRRPFTKAFVRGSLVGGFLFGLHQLFFFTALHETSVATVALTGALQPALVLLVAPFVFGERVRPRAIAWSVVALGGTVASVVAAAGSPVWSLHGDILAVLNLFAFTGYFLASRWILFDVEPFEYVVGMTTVSGILIALACVLTGQNLGAPEGNDWLILVSLAIGPGTLGHVLMNWSHRYVTAFAISILLLAVPVLAAIGAYLWLGEPLAPLQVAGGVVVLLAIGAIVAEPPVR